jgi:exodeoxyribonuclease VII large subunit
MTRPRGTNGGGLRGTPGQAGGPLDSGPLDSGPDAAAAAPPAEAMSVSEVTARVKEQVESRFADVWVAGEISNLVRAASGHVYLSLKDDAALLRAVVWRGMLPLLAIEPADGMEVVCHGRIEVYPPRGTYQLTIDRLHALGTGALEARFRRLHASLEREGLFAPGRKRPIPAFPARIAVITSPTGAAIADFLRTLFSRWHAAEVIVVPSRVQGAGAAEELAAALAGVARLDSAVDVIALVRGGGSLEDLWAFNEEVLVRAIAASPIPVVSGVGHEIDVTLADLAADLRALTPTDAAVRIVPDGVQVAATVAALGRRLRSGLRRGVDLARERMMQAARSRVFADPERILRDRRTVVEQQSVRLHRLARGAVERARERLGAAAGRLEAGSPIKLLARGWSVTWLADAEPAHDTADAAAAAATALPLASVAGVEPGGLLVTQLADGRIRSRVERIIPDDRRS